MSALKNTQWTTINLSTADTNLLIWIEAFLIAKRSENLAKGSIYFYTKKLKLFSAFCDTQVIKLITEITPDTIRRYLFWLDETNHNEGGIHAAYRALKAFLFWFEDENDLDNWRNPIRKVHAPKVALEPLQGISTADFQRLLDACGNNKFYSLRDKAILLTLLDTGIRANELIQLNIDDFDYISGTVLIRQGKGRKPRIVYTGKKTRKSLRAYLKRHNNSAPLFTTHAGDRLTYAGLREIILRLADRAKIEAPNLHDFRRSFALTLWRNKVDLQTIARLMGHTSLVVLQRYLKIQDQDLSENYKSPVDND